MSDRLEELRMLAQKLSTQAALIESISKRADSLIDTHAPELEEIARIIHEQAETISRIERELAVLLSQ